MRCFILFFLLAFGSKLSAQPVQQHGALHVSGVQLVDNTNQPIVLRGMSFGWSCFHPRFYTAGAINTLVNDWKCNVIRASLGVEPKNGYKEDSATQIQLIRNVVEACIKEGVYVIIDWHSHNINMEESKAFFTTMAKDYGKYPNVIYEIYNEPDYESWEEVKNYSTELINLIRKYDNDNIILVGNPHWDQDIHLVADSPLQGFNNIMYTLHFYAATHKQELRDRCNYALKKGIPIFISESAGMEASGNGPLNVEEWTKWIEWAEQNKISWITWSVSDKDETCSVLYPTAASEGNWTEKDLKESGIKTRELLRKYKKI